MPKKVINRKGGKAQAGSVTIGIGTTADTRVQAAVVAISQVNKDRRCAVCTYEATSDTGLGVHYVHEHRAGAPTVKKRSRLPKNKTDREEFPIVDLTAVEMAADGESTADFLTLVYPALD